MVKFRELKKQDDRAFKKKMSKKSDFFRNWVFRLFGTKNLPKMVPYLRHAHDGPNIWFSDNLL